MKQIVDFEQAKRLYPWFDVNSKQGFTKQGAFIYSVGLDRKHWYDAPTIGELIEWIWDKTNLLVEITNSTSAKGTVSVQWSCGMDYEYEGFELIDALVELAIKIKEQAE